MTLEQIIKEAKEKYKIEKKDCILTRRFKVLAMQAYIEKKKKELNLSDAQ